MSLALKVAESGETLDTLTLDGDGINYETGRARDLVEARRRSRELSEAETYAHLSGWSNGYLLFEDIQDAVPVASARSLLAAFDRGGSVDPSYEDIARFARAAGADTHPGAEELKHWALHTPEGLSKWATKPKPWTALYRFLLEKMDGNEVLAKLTASRWFIDHFGYASGSDIHRVKSGKPPRGKVIGPG